MPLTCSKCSRTNPPDAEYCHFDGVYLKDGADGSGPVNMATHPFPSPFIFPSGRTCRNFNELAMACFKEWPAAIEMMAQGDLASFLSGMGRMDLARVARESAKSPDPDRGLDDFISKLPTSVIDPPKLAVEPGEVNLGELRLGENRKLNLQLVNKGMRLLYGTITCKEVWLSLGETTSTQQKLFEFGSDLTVPVNIIGKKLQARSKPFEGQIVIESNGGTVTVEVRATVGVKPFAEGVLAGATNPKQIAEKAKAKPKEAAIFFENGAVARWYAANGWAYPVKGDATSGTAAIQQYFEAHGLAKPPRVELGTPHINLGGKAGEQLRCQLEVRTQERKHVYALASSAQWWVKVESTQPRGQSAVVNLVVTVPDRPGETAQARVAVRANGNQSFSVPINVSIEGRTRPAPPPPPPPPPPREAIKATPVWTPPSTTPDAPPPPPPPIPRRAGKTKWAMHLIPAFFLLVTLLGMGGVDYFKPEKVRVKVAVEEPPVDIAPRIVLRMHNVPDTSIAGAEKIAPTSRFGLVMTRETAKDPRDGKEHPKRLMFAERGVTNNTCVRIDGAEHIFGNQEKLLYDTVRKEFIIQKAGGKHLGGRWKEFSTPLGKDDKNRERDGFRSVWDYDNDKVVVTQTVEVIQGQVSQLYDTCLITYKIENQDSKPHNVGLRFMLDTYIGGNDGVPFSLNVPGVSGLCDTVYEFNRPQDVPAFIEALEHDNLEKPGTVARVQLHLGGRIEPPSRVTLGAWPDVTLRDLFKGKPIENLFNQHLTHWDVPAISMQSMKQLKANSAADSCVVLYWNEKELKAGDTREVGFTYGLGQVAANTGGELGLTVGGSLVVGSEFTVTALASNPQPGQKVTLTVTPSEGLHLKSPAEQDVPALPNNAKSRISPVSWKLQPTERGQFEIKVTSSTGTSQTVTLKITERGVFD